MLQFIIRRLLLLIPVLVGILLVTFIISRSIPADPCLAMLGEKATKEQCDLFKERFGLNDNIGVQFIRYMANMLRGDLGVSIKNKRPIGDEIGERLPMTIEITIGAMIFASTFGVLFGVISALKRNTPADVGTMIFANIGVSMPVFWLGLMLAYIFALVLKGTPFYIPPSGRFTAGISMPSLIKLWHLENLTGLPRFLILLISNSGILNGIVTGNFRLVQDSLWHLILPCIAVGTIPMAVIARMTRSSLLDVLGMDYIRTARAKGLAERLVISRHALRNALIPIVTIIGLQTGALLSGAVLTETIFSLPGVGTRMVDAILSRDYPVIQGFTLMIALIFVFTNLLVDISYAILDPRIRLE
jgi:peptide/nickel transport system permease protein